MRCLDPITYKNWTLRINEQFKYANEPDVEIAASGRISYGIKADRLR